MKPQSGVFSFFCPVRTVHAGNSIPYRCFLASVFLVFSPPLMSFGHRGLTAVVLRVVFHQAGFRWVVLPAEGFGELGGRESFLGVFLNPTTKCIVGTFGTPSHLD